MHHPKESRMGTRTALVTGVSSGIGHATAQALAKEGWRVFGTARSESTALPEHVERVVLDVRDPASIDAGVREVLDKAGRIDLLVNNAGGSVMGAIEETSIEQARDVFDVNFFGAARLTQAVLPAMRAQKSGRIVFISSVLGFLPAPFMGFYAASKHALEGLAESLDHETRTLGIRVALIEPSWTRTGIDSNAARAASPVADYGIARERVREVIRASVNAGDEPSAIAGIVLEAARAKNPRMRYPAGKRAGLLARLRRYMPAGIFDTAIRKQFRLNQAGGLDAKIA
jgi:NAD(P)-dependent dehydrogenase (short-subunit alcohol dehydrogenase family)